MVYNCNERKLKEIVMKKGSVFIILVLFLFVISCGDDATEESFMPDSLSIRLPSSVVGSSGKSILTRATTTNTIGSAYQQLKNYATTGKDVVTIIDAILGSVYQYRNYLMDQIGNKFNIDGTAWLYFNNNAATNGYYLYFGESESHTNFYIDWVKDANSKFGGKTVFWADPTDTEFDKALVYFNQGVANPYLDIFVKYKFNTVLSNIRVRIVELATSPLEVSIASKAIMQAPSDPDEGWINSWEIVGYGKEGANGGAIAIADGVTNEGDIGITNYRYNEYFDDSGVTLWKMAVAEITNAVTNVIDPENTYTNGTKPADVETILNSLFTTVRLTNTDFPVLLLP